jgi:GntR family transcriptional regulator/MocR family aminotransferase
MLVALEPDGATPMHRQIYLAIRAAILEGRLAVNTRLPASRVLADDLGVSRTTVLGAYDQLAAEGYIAGRAGGGTRVAADIPRPGGRGSRRPGRGAATGSAAVPDESLSALAGRVRAAYGTFRRDVPTAPFAYGMPALDAFPLSTWSRLMARRWRHAPAAILGNDDGCGFPALREAIAAYALTSRGVRCTPEEVVVTAGAQQGLDLIARLLVNPGDAVWLEEPGFRPARAALVAAGARVVEVPVDDEGIDVSLGRRAAPRARLALVTPSFQSPLGVTMSLRRRLALLAWAREANAWIVEDDYNGEFRYDGRPLASLQGLEQDGARRVIYLGTFSKSMFPALRIGYAIVPPELVDAFAWGRLMSVGHSPLLEQAVLADFIAEGHFARHVRHMRELYAERQQTFVTLAERLVGGLLHVPPLPAGMQLIGWLPSGVSDVVVSREARARGVLVEPLSRHRVLPSEQQGLVLGYVPFRPSEVRRALETLATVIRGIAGTRVYLPSSPSR